MQTTFIVITALFFVASCSAIKYDRLATEYTNRTPIAEAKSDYEQRNFKIYSAMGIGQYYPGLDQKLGRRIASEHGYMMLSGTSDALESRAHQEYVGAATSFAAEYNRQKAALIAQNIE